MNVKILSIAAGVGLLIGSSAVVQAREGAAPGQKVQGGSVGILAQVDRDDYRRDRDRDERFRGDRDRDDRITGRGDRDERFERERERSERFRDRDGDERRRYRRDRDD